MNLSQTIDTRTRLGAHYSPKGIRFTLWSPEHETAAVILKDGQQQQQRVPLAWQGSGYFTVRDPAANPGDLYWFAIDEGSQFPTWLRAFSRKVCLVLPRLLIPPRTLGNPSIGSALPG